MHSGYGIGAIFAVQILKGYIKFDPLRNLEDSRNFTSSSFITSKDISLITPYTIGGVLGVVIVLAFLIAQYFERKAIEKFDEEFLKRVCSFEKRYKFDRKNNKFIKSIQNMIFGIEFENGSSIFVLSLITTLIFFLFMFAYGTLTIVSTFMLTYLTEGPAKFNVSVFIQLQTLYWMFFIAGRLSAAFLGFKMNSLVFFALLISIELIFIALYALPFLNSIQMFYWFIIPSLGFILGPLVPSCFMIPKYLFKNINSFLLSIFFIGSGIGNISSQYATGFILDKCTVSHNWLYYSNPTSKYLIPFILFLCISICAIIFFIILIVYKINYKTVFLKHSNRLNSAILKS